jgi:hypothetical protein
VSRAAWLLVMGAADVWDNQRLPFARDVSSVPELSFRSLQQLPTLQALTAPRDFSSGAACVLLCLGQHASASRSARGQAANEPITRLTLLNWKRWARWRGAERGGTRMIVKILPNDRGDPPSKLADAELLFEEGVLNGLRLTGFAIWQSRRGNSRTVTVPARTYFVHGERRTYALLRAVSDEGSTEPVRKLILDAYAEFEQQLAVAT